MGFTPSPGAHVGQGHWALGWTGCPSATWLWAPRHEDRNPTQGRPDPHQSCCQFPEAVLGELSGSTLWGVSRDHRAHATGSEFKVKTRAESSNLGRWTPHTTQGNRKQSF